MEIEAKVVAVLVKSWRSLMIRLKGYLWWNDALVSRTSIFERTVHARLRWAPRRMKIDCDLSFWSVAKNLRAG